MTGFGGAGAIPFTSKIAWLDEHEIADADERDDFIYLIGRMDKVYRDFVAGEVKKNREKRAAQAKQQHDQRRIITP